MADLIKALSNFTQTENGALSNVSSFSNLVDFFGKSAAMRGKEKELISLFDKAFEEDNLNTFKALFYLRDIRGGQGERQAFRAILKHIALEGTDKQKEFLERNMDLIPEYGRWDDLYVFVDTPFQKQALDEMGIQFAEDNAGFRVRDEVSLLGKWLKSENASSPETKRLAKITRKHLGLNSKTYRKSLSALRKRIKVLEKEISKNNWDIDFSKVPSQAMNKYKSAFYRHNQVGFEKYLEQVKSGEKKINASTLYPYEIIRSGLDETAEQLWNNLPNYISDNTNILSVVDTSGSMYGNREWIGGIAPINVAVSIGLYTAERCNGYFKNHFFTFSENPNLQKIKGKTLKQKIENLENANWGYNTDLIKVFTKLLTTAKKNKVPKEQMPEMILVISDMQFDEATKNNSFTNFEYIEKLYKESNYKMPKLVFWNVNAQGDMPATTNDKGVVMVSGCSPSILKQALNAGKFNPLEFVLEVLNQERYYKIR